MAAPIVFEGYLAVKALLKGKRRIIRKIMIRQGMQKKKFQYIIDYAREQNVRVSVVSEETLQVHTQSNSHGGIIAIAGERESVLWDDYSKTLSSNSWVAMLDGIEDPYNYAHSLRCLYAAGCACSITRPRTWEHAEHIIARSSGGAGELLDSAESAKIQDAVAIARARGMKIVCASGDASESLYDVDLTGDLFWLIGGERRGITRSIIDSADMAVHIPYARTWNVALPTSSAVSIIAFETARQRS